MRSLEFRIFTRVIALSESRTALAIINRFKTLDETAIQQVRRSNELAERGGERSEHGGGQRGGEIDDR